MEFPHFFRRNMTLQDKLIDIEEKITYLEYLAKLNQDLELTKIMTQIDEAKRVRAEIRSEILDRKLMGYL